VWLINICISVTGSGNNVWQISVFSEIFFGSSNSIATTSTSRVLNISSAGASYSIVAEAYPGGAKNIYNYLFEAIRIA
jgi:hypothetical protein